MNDQALWDSRALGFGGNDSSFFFDYALTGIDDERSGFPGGHTDSKTRTAGGDPFWHIENGTWSTSGFASLLYANGPFFASSTFALQASKVGGSGNWAFTWENNVGYQITDSLTVIGIMRYFQMLEDGNDQNIDDENYSTFGAKLNYGFPDGGNLYAGFEFDAWNDTYDTEALVTGYSRPF